MPTHPPIRLGRLIAVIALAALLRAWAALLLPVDFDEPIYVQAGMDYARIIRAGDWQGVIDYPGNREHPPLVKLLYAGGALALGEGADATDVLFAARAISALAGVLAVAALAWLLGPLAGGLLAIHTMAVKYTSQAYLDALPLWLATVALGLLARGYGRAGQRRRPPAGLWLSAVALGAAAASKLTVAIVAPAAIYLLWRAAGQALSPSPPAPLSRARERGDAPQRGAADGAGAHAMRPGADVRPGVGEHPGGGEADERPGGSERPGADERPGGALLIAGYLLVAAISFFALNPALWGDPVGRLLGQAGFHLRYSQGADVAAAAYPWFQPLVWLGSSAPAGWHPEVFFYFGFDGLIFLLALGGLPVAWRDPGRRWLAVWLAGGALLLLLWPTRWPQYTLPLLPAVCALAAISLRRIGARLRELEDYWGWAAEMLPRPPRYAWAAIALLLSFVLGIYGYGLAGVAIGGMGWSRVAPAELPQPAGPLYAALGLPDGRVAIAGEQGALLWQEPAGADQPPLWLGLPIDRRALALAYDPAGALWVGTAGGLVRLADLPDGDGPPMASAGGAGEVEAIYRAQDFGVGSDVVYALALGGDGRLWVGTGAGAAMRGPGGAWEPLPQAAGGGLVSAVAVEPRPAGDRIWFGGMGGVSRLDTATGAWEQFGRAAGFGAAGVGALLVDSRGRVWAGTLGDGLARWEADVWSWLTPANSGLPYSLVTALAEPQPGVIWVGCALPIESGGGALASYDGAEWRAYLPRNSGYTGAEPLAMARDAQRRLWIATRGGEVVVYQLP